MRTRRLVLLALVMLCFIATSSWAQDPTFIRGDVNDDGIVDRADSTMLHAYVWSAIPPDCVLAADVNDLDGMADFTDLIYIGNYLSGGADPPPPFPNCGPDPTDPQSGDACCTMRGTAPSISLTGAFFLVLLIMASAVWFIRRNRATVPNP